MRRLDNFSMLALAAALCTLALAGFKYWLAVKSETDGARVVLSNTAKSLTKAMKMKFEFDLSTLDSVANIWHLDSRMSREAFRRQIVSDYFQENLLGMETILLTHRIMPHQRDAMENDPAAIRVRQDCCSGSVYDMPTQGSTCRIRAKNQCRIPGPHRYYFTQLHVYENGTRAVLPASRGSSEYLVVMYQEPLERHPGPMGLDMFSSAPQRDAFLESDRTGMKGMTKRMLRIFASTPEFGMLVWNNVFVDRNTSGGRAVLEGVNLTTKARILEARGDPYSIGSVVAVYKVQTLLKRVVQDVFGEDVQYTKIYLFDDRDQIPPAERLLAIYDTDGTKTDEQVNQEVIQESEKTLEELITAEHYEENLFEVRDTSARFRVVLVPYDAFLEEHRTHYPGVILAISLILILAAQLERWAGHPYIMSEVMLARARIEQEMREEVEPEIVGQSSMVASEISLARKRGSAEDAP